MLHEEHTSELYDEEFLRLEEIITHPKDLAFSSLEHRKRSAQKNLSQERNNLNRLLNCLPAHSPKDGTKEHELYQNIQMQIQLIKNQISEEHNELMEILKNQEKSNKK